MKQELDALKGKEVKIFCSTLSGASCMIIGKLIGDDLPGRPYGVVNYDPAATISTATISFKHTDVKRIQTTPVETIIQLR